MAAPRTKRSSVWEYFEESDKKHAKCTVCNKVLAYHGGTSNLRSHLSDVHKISFESAGKSPAVGGSVSAGDISSFFKPKACSQQRTNGTNERIVEFIARDLRPVSVVSGVGFKGLLAWLEPGYTVPSATCVTKLVRRRFLQGRDRLVLLLKSEVGISFTTDMWTSSKTQGYITITGHFIDQFWELRSCVLTTKHFPERHTAENISKTLKKQAEEFGILEKVPCVVHDQASNMKAAMRNLQEEVAAGVTGDDSESSDDVYEDSAEDDEQQSPSGDNTSDEGENNPESDVSEEDSDGKQESSTAAGFASFECAAHALQSSLQAGLSVRRIQTLLKAGKKIVQHFHHSTVAAEALRKKQRENNKSEKVLLQECVTRWNSGFMMLERLLEQRWHVTAVLDEEKRAATSKAKKKAVVRNLDTKQWGLAAELVDVLQPFTLATTFLSAQNNVSVSCVLPLMDRLQASLKPSGKDCQALKEFKKRACRDIRTRFSFDEFNPESIAVLTSALDPRFKALHYLTAGQGEQVATRIIKRCEDSVKKEATDEGECSSASSSIPPPCKRKKIASREAITDLDALFGPEDKCDTTIPVEVQRYFADPPASRSDDPLQWWRKNESRFPHVAKLARTYLAIPATSTPSERVFSAAGNIVTKKRAALSAENVDALIFLNKNWSLLFQVQPSAALQHDVQVKAKPEEYQKPTAADALPDLPG